MIALAAQLLAQVPTPEREAHRQAHVGVCLHDREEHERVRAWMWQSCWRPPPIRGGAIQALTFAGFNEGWLSNGAIDFHTFAFECPASDSIGEAVKERADFNPLRHRYRAARLARLRWSILVRDQLT